MLELGEQWTCHLCKANWTEMISLFDSNTIFFDHKQGNTGIKIQQHYKHIFWFLTTSHHNVFKKFNEIVTTLPTRFIVFLKSQKINIAFVSYQIYPFIKLMSVYFKYKCMNERFLPLNQTQQSYTLLN